MKVHIEERAKKNTHKEDIMSVKAQVQFQPNYSESKKNIKKTPNAMLRQLETKLKHKQIATRPKHKTVFHIFE